MYVVSEITGKRYATVDECVADEREYVRKQDAKKLERLDNAWKKVINAAEEFYVVVAEIEPERTEEIEMLLRVMKSI